MTDPDRYRYKARIAELEEEVRRLKHAIVDIIKTHGPIIRTIKMMTMDED